jgi:hypothetical protein
MYVSICHTREPLSEVSQKITVLEQLLEFFVQLWNRYLAVRFRSMWLGEQMLGFTLFDKLFRFELRIRSWILANFNDL